MVHETSCPGVGYAGDDACPGDPRVPKRYAADSIRNGLKKGANPTFPSVKGLIFNFQLGKALRPSGELVVVVESRDWPAIFAFRAVTAYISWMGLNRRVPVPRGYDWR